MKNDTVEYKELVKLFEHSIEQLQQEAQKEKPKGEDLEQGIVAVWNRDPFPKLNPSITPEGCAKIVKFLMTQGVDKKEKAVQLGRGNYDVTKDWEKHFPEGVPAATKTPKSDLMIGKYKISLKGGDAAQLMSGGRNESIATFDAASKSVNLAPKVAKKIEIMIGNMAISSVAASELGKEIKKAKDKVIVAADKLNKELMSELGDLFSKNEAFANAFAFEAMSGLKKFRGSVATCNVVLASDWNGDTNHFNVLKSNSKFVSNVAKSMKLSVRFKSLSEKSKGEKTGRYRYWSVIGLILSGMDKLHEETFKPGEVITEGKISDFLGKIKDWVINALKKIGTWLSESFSNILEFFGWEPIVSVEQEINFLEM